MEDVSKEREKEARDLEKDRMGSRERKREDRDEREKGRSGDSKLREKDYDREKYRDKDRERDKDKKEWGKDILRRKGRWRKKLIEGKRRRGEKRKLGIGIEKRKGTRLRKGGERGIEIVRRIGKATEMETKVRGRIRFTTKKGKQRSRDKVTRKTLEEDEDYRVDIHDKRGAEVGKQGKTSNLDGGKQNGEASGNTSAMELEERILK